MAEPVYYQGLFARPGGNMVFVHSKGQADEYDNSGTLQQSVDASYEVMNQGNFIAWLDTYMDLAGNLYIYGSQSGGGSRLISYDPDFALRFDEPDLQFYRLDVSRSGQIAYKSWDRGVVLCDSMFAEIAAFPELTEPNSNVVFDDKSLLYAGNAGQTYMISKAGKLQKILNGSFVRDDSAAAPGYMIVENGSYNLYQSGELQYVLDESLRTVQIQRFLLDNAPFSSPRPQFSAPAAGLLSAFAGERNLFARLGPSGEIILVRDGVITGYEIDGTVRWRIDPDMDVFEITVDPEQGRLLVALGPLGIDAVRAYELP